jgi:glucan biosynthesis protein C
VLTTLAMVYIHLSVRGVPGMDTALSRAARPSTPCTCGSLPAVLVQRAGLPRALGAGAVARRGRPRLNGRRALFIRRLVMESGSFLPSFSEWLQSGLFFVFGW